MKKLLLILFCSVLLSNPLLSEKFSELNQEEKQIRREKLKKYNRDTFVNRSNEKADEETRKADYEAGKKLSQILQSGSRDVSARGITIKRIPSTEDGKNGGDILEFTETVYFGHVNTIVRIITGFIRETYGYSLEDAELVSLYSVYYNLKHRQDEPYFLNNFIDKLVSSTSKDKIGLDENFEEWRGKTQFVIPIEKNILNKSGFDIATFELEDQVSTELEFQKDAVETKKKYNTLQNKKIKIEKEESQKRLISTKTKEKEMIQKSNSLEERLRELSKDPEANKEELAKLEAEKEKFEEEKNKLEEDKKTFEKKTVQVNQRDEMRKIGITSEKEYKDAVKNKKLPEIYVDPVTSEVKSKGTMSQEYALMKEKNTPKEPYTGSANSVGIPNSRNRNLPVEKESERMIPESGLVSGSTSTPEQTGAGRNLSGLQTSGTDGKGSSAKPGTQGNRSTGGGLSGPGNDLSSLGEISVTGSVGGTGSIDKTGNNSKLSEGRAAIGNGGFESQSGQKKSSNDEGKSGVSVLIRNGGESTDGKPNSGSDSRTSSSLNGERNRDGKGDFNRDGKGDSNRDGKGDFNRDGKGDFNRDGKGDSNRDGMGGNKERAESLPDQNKDSTSANRKNLSSQNSMDGYNSGGKVSVAINRNEQTSGAPRTGNPIQDALNDQLAALSNPGKNQSESKSNSEKSTGSQGTGSVLKIGEENRKKVTIKVISEYNLAFYAARLNISAREFIKAPETGYIVIGRKLPVKSDDLGLFLLDVQELDLKGNANGIVLHKNSPLMYYYNRIIVYEKYNNNVYLTQLNMNLKVDFRSPQPIDPDTSITIEGDTISLMRYNSQENIFQSSLYKLSDFSAITE